MHIAIVMNHSLGVKIRRSDLIRFLQSRGHHVTVVCAIDAAATDLRNMGVSLINWKVSPSSMNPLREALSVVRLRHILATLEPDIILNFTPKAILYSSIAARSTHRSSVFSVFAGLGFLFTEKSILCAIIGPLMSLVFHLALRNNLLVFFQNPDDKNLFVSKHIVPVHRTSRVYGSGVDTKRFVPRAPRKAHDGTTTFLMIARLLEHKGVLDYLVASAILRDAKCSATANLLGPLDDHPSAIDESTLRSYEDSGAVHYMGSTTDVRPYLEDADVFVLPSYREGTPRSTLEAMAMAKPIITTDSPGCRETVIDGHNGYIVPVRNAPKLAAAMRKFVGNECKIREMGLRSRQLAEDLYDVEEVNRHLWREILRVCDTGAEHMLRASGR